MRSILRKPVLFALSSLAAAWFITAGVAYGATVFTRSLNASVNIVSEAEFSFYSDQAATQLITQVSLPDTAPGDTSTFTFYVKNTSPVTETVSVGSSTIPSSIGTLTLTFNGQAQKALEPGDVTRVTGTLTVDDDAAPGPIDFNFSVSAATAPAPPSPNEGISGQQLFSTYCLTCHASGPPGTNRSQAQLLTFIAGHRTGSSLTTEEIAAIASFIKP